MDTLCDHMGDFFPELISQQELIIKVIKEEEQSFLRTLSEGLKKLDVIMRDAQDIVSGELVFELYDTYGFPVDLTELIAKENGFDIDKKSFDDYMNQQKQRARSSHKFKSESNIEDWTILSDVKGSEFLGYKNISCNSKIIK